MKRVVVLSSLLGLWVSLIAPTQLSAEFLFDSYLIPSFDGQSNSEFSQWDVFYAPDGGINYPDIGAPNGSGVLFSETTGFTLPVDSEDPDPFAFWNLDNPTLAQDSGVNALITTSSADPGNIYSFSGATSFTVNDTTPYTVQNVLLQFKTDGTRVDFSSIRIEYDDNGNTVSLAPNEYIREYRNSGSSFGGTANRNAVQWDLTGLGITTYQVRFGASSSSMSLQDISIDTYNTYTTEVPEGRRWNTSGSQSWATTSNWVEGTSSQTNGNVVFQNLAATTISDSTARTVGEITFSTAFDVALNRSAALTSNTGIVTPGTATGNYSINGNYVFGAYNVFTLQGGTTTLNGIVSGDYGLLKEGNGTLILTSNNTFGAGGAGVGISGGILRMEGTNAYTGPTAVSVGELIVAGNAPISSPGTLGNASSNVTIGLGSFSSGVFPPAILTIDGNHTVARDIDFNVGDFDKRLGARNASSGATYTGQVQFLFNLASGTHFFAEGATDIVNFSGAISGGTSSDTLGINPDGAAGTVRYTTSNKTYTNTTTVQGGTLYVESGVSVSSNIIVDPDASSTSSRLAGEGTFTGTVTVNSGGVLAPGASPGMMNTGNLSWNSGGTYQVEVNDSDAGAGTGWDLLNVTGSLAINSTAGSPFIIDLDSLNTSNEAGAVADFSSSTSYSWTIVQTSGGITGFSADKFTIDTSGFQNALSSGTFSVTQDNNNLVLVFTPDSGPIDTWLESNFTTAELADPQISGDDADFDNDGLSTLLEYAFNLNPKVADSNPNLTMMEINSTDFGNMGDEFLTVTFTRLLDRTDINYLVCVGDSPGNLNTVVVQSIGGASPTAVNGGDIDAEAPAGNTQVITAVDNTRVQDATKRFMAVCIERN